MSEPKPSYITASVSKGWVIAAPVEQQVIVTLTRQEIKLILRLRDAAQTGQMILVDPDAMVWYAVGKMEVPR